MKRSLILACLISSFALASCGIKGDLRRPPPLWGEDNRTEAEKAGNKKPAPEETAPTPEDTPERQRIIIRAPEPVEEPSENPVEQPGG